MNKRLLRDLKAACYSENPAFVRGAALTILVMASTSLATAGAVSLAMALTVLPSLLFCGILEKRLSRGLLLPALVILNAAAYLPVGLFLNALFPVQIYSAGIYLPLTAVCGASLFWRGDMDKRRPFLPLPGRLVQLAGFCLVLCAVAFLREWLGKGGPPGALPWESIPGLSLPFSGFIVLGFVLALLQSVHMAVQKLSRMGRRKRGRKPGRKNPNQTAVL